MFRHARLTGLLFILSLVCNIPASRAQGFLHASGTKIVNGSGQEVRLRGIGLGGWLVPEGYMLGTSGFANSPSQFKKKVSDLIGPTNTDAFFKLYRQKYVNRRDIDRIAGWGFNSIRVPMHYALFTPRDQPGVYLEEGFLLIDSLLSWCEANHLYLILDLHCAPGGQNNDNISDYDPSFPSLWESATNQSRTVDLWKKLAERYATKQWIGGYDLLNETARDLGTGNVPLRALYGSITGAIREVDTNHIVFIEGNWYATDFSGLTPPWDKNMAYSFHKYWNTPDAGSINYLLSLRSSNNVPLWLGESGENSNAWFTTCIKLMEDNSIGWAWWPHKKFDSVVGPLSAIKPPEYEYVLRYWRGEVPSPGSSYGVAALTMMAEALDIDRCVQHPDVIDAIVRQPFNTSRLPFTTTIIPGIVYAVNYDLGTNGVAYNDNDFQITGGAGSGSWNNGWNYRNDGVDIDVCSDFPTVGYCVGWVGTGEYLHYTVNVSQTGTYRFTLRAAANNGGGYTMLKWDFQTMSSAVPVPAGGGWQNWMDVDLGTYALTAGIHTLSLHFFFGGFNVNYVEVAQTSAAVEQEEGQPARFELLQNYPNPFNPRTQIGYSIPESRESAAGSMETQLVVYDLLGREVAVLVNEKKATGNYEVEFDASALASGVYIYRLTAGQHAESRTMVLMK
jgi:endoglucanase